ncbi:DWNN-domain-containing protein [Mytilinidion resinicola]|uniref:DWNN-domain-containing protein n=1 Tax=Mytilinidion resinicola TaxID=574789 RepID=A0A6A6YH96_9PEZI|nr:DWNN-domain-containing protein [Mytilinidion resinicola]KAF2807969.1 DWNN-domain-containing protein [Mytilinidion resinicola]
MTSSVFFKFKSSKEPQRIPFDGTGISVFELKREIIIACGLGDGRDFDLSIYNEDTPPEEYDDDTTIIARSSLVIARRLPASKPGCGKAARYISGTAPVTARNTHRKENHLDSKAAFTATTKPADPNKPMTEEDRIKAMFSASGDQWDQQQKQMASAKPVYHKNFNKKPASVPEHDPPPGYICYRCHEKGHWIQACPTNDDPNFKSQPRIKRTTGIPRSFLKTVEKPFALTEDGLTDNSKQPSGVMVNAEGEYVIAEPDKASWEQFQAKTKASAAQAEAAETGSKELRDRGLECPLDNRMFVEPMKTPCCGKTYCNECIENALVENDLVCPNCNKDGVLIDDLVADDDMTAKIKAYEDQKIAERRAKEVQTPEAKSSTKDTATNPPKASSESPLSNVSNSSNTTSNTSVSTSTPYSVAAQPGTSSNSKKRPAEEDLHNERKPSPPRAPAAMRRQQEQAQQQQQQQQWPASVPRNEQEFIAQMNALANIPPMTSAMSMPGMYSAAPMMGMNPAYGMGMPTGMGMGMPMGMNNMPMNMNNMGMMNGYPNGNGWGNQRQQQQYYSNGNNQNWGQHQQQQPMHQQQPGSFPNQQRNVFSNPGPNDEDAYFRKPVNPHRGRPKHRVMRPSDYTEL